MRRQPLHESLGGSVMTKRPRRRAQISRDHLSPPASEHRNHYPHLTTTRIHSTNTASVQSKKLKTTCKARLFTIEGSLPHQAFKTSIFGRPVELANVLTQVGRLPRWNLVLLFLVLSLLTQPAMCKPWIDERPDKITFRSRICQQVSSTELRKRMGTIFDEERMAADMATARRLIGDDGMASWAKSTEGYQSDGPAAQLANDGSSLVETERYLSSGDVFLREEGMIYTDNERMDEREEVDIDLDLDNERVQEREEVDVDFDMQEGDVKEEGSTSSSGKRSWLPRRRILHSHRRNRDRGRSRSDLYEHFKTSEKDEFKHEAHGVMDSYKYMRRRRRRRSLKPYGFSGRVKTQNDDSPRKTNKLKMKNSKRKVSSPNVKQSSKKSSNSFLPLRLILSGKLRNSRKLRKQLKKEFRQQSRKLNKPPPWQCKFTQTVVFMKKNVFPPVLLDGKCGTDKCFYRLYNCEPNKFAIKLLQRDENHCNPIPVVGNSTVFEEKWNIITQHITVGCNCASLVGNGKNKNRRKN